MGNEIWKPVVGFEGLYEVSSTGKVKTLAKEWKSSPTFISKHKERILCEKMSNSGYLLVSLYKNNKQFNGYIHRLVAGAFVPNPDGKPEVNHIDGNKLNNCPENLEWVTRKENVHHAQVNGLLRTTPVEQYDLDGNLVRKWGSIKEAADQQGFLKSGIIACCNGRYRTSNGYRWKYSEKESKEFVPKARRTTLIDGGKFKHDIVTKGYMLAKLSRETGRSQGYIWYACELNTIDTKVYRAVCELTGLNTCDYILE